MIYGIHIGDYHNLVHHIKETHKLKCNALQIFLGNKTLTTLSEKYKPSKEEIKEIKDLLKKYKIDLYCHAILTLNYCNDPESKRNMWGLTNLIYDMDLLYKMGGKACVIHVGHYKTKKIDLTKNECYIHFINSLKYVIDPVSPKLPTLFLNTNSVDWGSKCKSEIFCCRQMRKSSSMASKT